MAMTVAALAGPLRRADLPAHPDWFVHLDCDVLRKTYLGEYLLYQLGKPERYGDMMSLRALLGFDFRTQLHGLTLYALRPSVDDCVTIAYADFPSNEVAKLLRDGKGRQVETRWRHPVFSWEAGGGPEGRNFAAICGNRLIGAKSRAAIIAALAVLDGKSPGGGQGTSMPDLPASNGTTFLQALGHRLPFLESGPGSVLFNNAKWVHLQANETSELVNAELTMKVDDAETARQIALAARGMLAFFALPKDPARFGKLAAATAVTHEGSKVVAKLSLRTLDLINALKAYSAEAEREGRASP